MDQKVITMLGVEKYKINVAYVYKDKLYGLKVKGVFIDLSFLNIDLTRMGASYTTT